PYDIGRRQWAASTQPGQWLVGFSPPPQVGQLKPLRVTLWADVTAPQQTIRFFRGQCQGGTPRPSALRLRLEEKSPSATAGERVASWTLPIGQQNVSFSPRPEDYDQHGR